MVKLMLLLLDLNPFTYLLLMHPLCRNSGTWGSSDAAKVGPTSGPTKKTSKTWTQDRRWATPSPP